MAFSGFYARVRPGEICQNATDPGQLSPDAFTVGVNGEFGARILQRLQQQGDRGGKINWDIPERRWQCLPRNFCLRG